MPEHEENFDVVLERVLKIALRRRWWVLIPATVLTLCAASISFMLPEKYESDATIFVEPQQVPERYVTANTTIDVNQMLLTMTDAVLSRTQLLKIIDEFGLYSQKKGHLGPEQLVALIRGNIKLEPLQEGPGEPKDLNAFKISFTDNDAHTAQKVTSRLTTLFINVNNESREEQSTSTTNFLADQLKSAEEDLRQQESRVREFKMSNLGELPEEQANNLAFLSGLQGQLQNTMAALSRAREHRAYLQTMLSQYQEISTGVSVSGAPIASPAETIKGELSKLESEKTELLGRYTEKYPDVVKINEQIKETEALLAAVEDAAPPAKDRTAQETKQAKPLEKNPAMAQLTSELESNRLEIDADLADQKQTETRIAEYQRRLNLTPVREQQLTDLLRNYNQSKQHYEELLSKKTDSELATNMVKQQQGQRFQIIDQPSLPSRPSSPARLKISLAGLAVGVGIGAALAFLLEIKNHSLRDERELRRDFSFPLMLGVPILQSKVEERRRLRFAVLEGLVATLLCLVISATELYVYWRG